MCCCCCCSSSSGGRAGGWSVFCSISHRWMRGRPGAGVEGRHIEARGRRAAPAHLHTCNDTQGKTIARHLRAEPSPSCERGRHPTTPWVSTPDPGAPTASPGISHPLGGTERRGAQGEGERVFLAVMVWYVGGGWFEGRSDRLLAAAGKKDVGGCLPRVLSNPEGPGGWMQRAACLSGAVGGEEPTGGWTLPWSLSGLPATPAPPPAPSEARGEWKKALHSQFLYGLAFICFQTLPNQQNAG